MSENDIMAMKESCLSEFMEYSNKSGTIIRDELRRVINLKNRVNRTAIDIAVRYWPEGVVHAILELGASVGEAKKYRYKVRHALMGNK